MPNCGFSKLYNGVVHRYHWCGPGGWYCVCCGPAPKDRRKFRRRFRRVIRQTDNKEFNKWLVH